MNSNHKEEFQEPNKWLMYDYFAEKDFEDTKYNLLPPKKKLFQLEAIRKL